MYTKKEIWAPNSLLKMQLRQAAWYVSLARFSIPTEVKKSKLLFAHEGVFLGQPLCENAGCIYNTCIWNTGPILRINTGNITLVSFVLPFVSSSCSDRNVHLRK